MTHLYSENCSLQAKNRPYRVRYFHDAAKEELIDFLELQDFDGAWTALEPWLEVEYHTRRLHSALDYATPAELEVAHFQRLRQATF